MPASTGNRSSSGTAMIFTISTGKILSCRNFFNTR
jgi:hypothetical protein